MYNLQNVKIMKAKFDQTSVVIILLVVITSIVVYTWISFAELINFFDHAASEAFTGMKVVGL